MSTEPFRQLSAKERQLLERLLDARFPGREALAEQSKDVLARCIDDEGSLEFLVHSSTSAAVRGRIPIEAEFEDADGVTVHVLLHVVEGKMAELEIYKDDSTPIRTAPDPTHLRLVELP